MSAVKWIPSLKTTLISLVAVPATIAVSGLPSHGQSAISGAERWLEVEQIYGDAVLTGSSYRAAQVGDRLSLQGDGITTTSQSASTLAIDSGIGRVQMAQNTRLQVNQLAIQSDGARVTVLDISRGQVRVQARRFTNPNSRLEVQTPSGVAAVRGTEFGVSINPGGTMAIATESGAVELSAPPDAPAHLQSQSVMVHPGYMSTIVPGEAPSAPRLIDRRLHIEVLRQEHVGGRIKIKAKVDPANSVLLNGEEVVMDKEGLITATLALHHSVLEVTVRNPMGESREHLFWVKYD